MNFLQLFVFQLHLSTDFVTYAVVFESGFALLDKLITKKHNFPLIYKILPLGRANRSLIFLIYFSTMYMAHIQYNLHISIANIAILDRYKHFKSKEIERNFHKIIDSKIYRTFFNVKLDMDFFHWNKLKFHDLYFYIDKLVEFFVLNAIFVAFETKNSINILRSFFLNFCIVYVQYMHSILN